MGVEFEQDYRPTTSYTSRTVLGQAQVPGMANWLLKKGVIKEESQAKGVLVGIMIINFIVMGFVVYKFVL
jgi:hypothetical protein